MAFHLIPTTTWKSSPFLSHDVWHTKTVLAKKRLSAMEMYKLCQHELASSIASTMLQRACKLTCYKSGYYHIHSELLQDMIVNHLILIAEKIHEHFL